MTTLADAYEVLAIVTACHHRTAPRMDDPEVAQATATVWAELLNGYDFTTDELITAVKSRAQILSDAPEPADIIRVARAKRADEMGRNVEPDGSIEPAEDQGFSRGWHSHPGDDKAAPEPADYPRKWTSEQRLSAYWYAIQLGGLPTTTAGWVAIDKQLKKAQQRRREQREENNV